MFSLPDFHYILKLYALIPPCSSGTVTNKGFLQGRNRHSGGI
uniref:Uncharacterized protein n=1 Tax=Myoviridae sp. cte5Z19 TaxID=2825145 RepID=A0A8S5NVH2_9CAUD|nr:MAG TPA: hypothetical protein [Myoviridae sp. cte5Z19]